LLFTFRWQRCVNVLEHHVTNVPWPLRWPELGDLVPEWFASLESFAFDFSYVTSLQETSGYGGSLRGVGEISVGWRDHGSLSKIVWNFKWVF
jgi:hypothetical protein